MKERPAIHSFELQFLVFMKQALILLFFMSSITTFAQQGKATTEKKTFSRTTTVSQEINASRESIWKILTTSVEYQRWNSTIVSLTGEIVEKGKIELVSTLDSSRTFKLKIKEFIPNERLVWGDFLGERVYTLEQKGETTIFNMTEKIGGFMFPLFANKIPPFDQSFEDFARDLKQEAEN